MKNNKRNIKTKNNLNQFIIAVTIIILSILIGYITKENELSEDVSNYNTKTNIINDTNINDIPEYSGEIVITINNDIPYFEEKDISNEDFEYYSNLDELGRAGVAFANICKYTMPPKDTKRGSLSYKPTGWEQYLYGENNSKHLYERCHLIAWQLGNENNNKRNLLTGTSQMNSAMIEYENIVANWIKLKNKENKDYHVLYRVTPIYKESNLLASGVQMESWSIEDNGTGIHFNVYCYNVQPGIVIDYATGESHAE